MIMQDKRETDGGRAFGDAGTAPSRDGPSAPDSLGGRLRAGGRELLADEKRRLVQRIGGYRSAVLEAGSALRSEDHPVLARQLDTAAASVGDLQQYLGERTPAELLDEAGHLFRKHPALGYTGAFLTGLGIARFLKARPPIDGDEDSARPGGSNSNAGDAGE